ncbi:MAG: rhodanese-like domain-containing protein, partial [Thermoflexales bacterium]
MNYDILISVAAAAGHFGDPGWLFVDCRYTLGDARKGRRDFEAGHLPGALFASLDGELASPHVPGRTGRHPLPEKEAWVETLSDWGIDPSTQVVAYDAGVGQSAAGRLWWMLKWAGHDRVAVLDGGIPQWAAAGQPLTTAALSHRQRRRYVPRWRDDLQVSAAEVAARLAAGSATVLDARAVERFRGDV